MIRHEIKKGEQYYCDKYGCLVTITTKVQPDFTVGVAWESDNTGELVPTTIFVDELSEAVEAEKPWNQKEKSVTLTKAQWSSLTTYLLMTTNYRKGETETWERLAEEKEESGEVKFKSATDYVKFWKELSNDIEEITKAIEAR